MNMPSINLNQGPDQNDREHIGAWDVDPWVSELICDYLDDIEAGRSPEQALMLYERLCETPEQRKQLALVALMTDLVIAAQ